MTQHTFFLYLEQLGLPEDAETLVRRVVTYVKSIIDWIPRTLPDFTDHGLLHSTNVLKYIVNIIQNYSLLFTDEEKLVLALASILHDIGCIYGREEHNKNSLRVLTYDEMAQFLNELDIASLKSLEQVIVSHSKSYDFNILTEDLSDKIRLKLICPLFRLADACDVSTLRVNALLFRILEEEDMLNKESLKIWKSHLALQNISFTPKKIIIYVNNFRYSEYCLNDIYEELMIINKTLEKNGYDKFKVEIFTETQEKNVITPAK